MRALILAIAAFFADFGSKRYIERTRREGETEERLGGRIRIQRLSNAGTAGGHFRERTAVILAVTTAASLVTLIRFLVMLPKKGAALTKAGLALMTAGALGNLNDRWTRGTVTDFIRFRTPFAHLSRLVFNLADFFLFVGSIFCVLGSFGKRGRDR